MGAYGLGAVTAFVVAFALLVSVSSTPTAQAATIDFAADDADNAVIAAPGDTVNVAVASAFATVSITSTADGVGASFVASGGQSVACSDNDSTCDVDDSDPGTTGRQNVAGAVSVALKIDADSGAGHILLSVGGLGTAPVAKVITVSKDGLVGSLELKADTPADRTIGASATSNLTATVKNAAATPAGLVGQSVSVTTTHGTVGCGTGAGTASAGNSQTCSANTDAAGVVDILLTGGGVEGIASVTARLGTRTATVEVTLFGSAKNLSAEPMQDSVEIGGSVFVVLTVTDDAGNPVRGEEISPVTNNEVAGPGDNPVLVTTSKDTTPNDTSDGSGYNVDYIATQAANNLPACGDDKDPVTDTGATPPTTEHFATNGTNAAGKCVVQVNTQKAAGTTKATTRGEHTINFAIGSIKASATIEVAGAPASITTDAPAMVATASVTEITVSVFDDEDVLVGDRAVNIRKVGGDGLVEDAEMTTTNGKATFSFIAPSSVGSSEILITAGDVNHRVTLQIGEPEADEPEEPEAAPSLTVQGNLGIFSGGSLEEFGAAAEAACPGGAVIWVQAADGTWVNYDTTAPPFARVGFETSFSGGFAGQQLVWVSDCQ